jgi:hypothetical protein
MRAIRMSGSMSGWSNNGALDIAHPNPFGG